MPNSPSHTAGYAPVTVGAAVLFIVAAYIGLKPGSAGPENKASGEKGLPVVLATSLTGEEPHRQFILGPPEAMEGAGQSVQPGVGKPFGNSPPASGMPSLLKINNLDCLIATVPDPIDTPFGFWYDQVVESLTRVVCDAGGYVPGKQWSPWEQFRMETRRHRATAAATFAPLALFEEYPGVLLFDGKGEPARRLAVLLVGETPKGVRTKALRRALELAREVSATESPVHVRLVSPFFTGSLPSLRSTIANWKPTHPAGVTIDIITGAANEVAPKDVNEWIASEQLANHRTLKFRSTMLPSQILRNAAVHFLKKGAVDRRKDVSADLRREDVERVAFLMESNTGFGRAQLETPQPECTQVKGVERDKRGERGERGESSWPIFLPYPLHLSRVQAKYAKQRLEKEKKFGLADSLLSGEGRRDPRSNPDLLPTLDEGVTPAITDRTVDDITSSIRRKRIRFVGILATDPEDKVFLVERIKANCPNVTVFITGNDLYYALPENRHIMRNVLISSTYPLTPFNQWWTEPGEMRGQTFRSDIAQGYYNAAGTHVSEEIGQNPVAVLQEYAPPVFTWYGDCRPQQVLPPAWILTVGENGQFVPLGFYNRFEDNKGRALIRRMVSSPPPSAKTKVDLPGLGSFRVLITVVFVAMIGLFSWLLRGQELSEFAGRASAKARSWWGAEMYTEEQRLSVYQGFALAAASFGVLPLISILLVLLRDWFEQSWWSFACLVVILALAVLLVLGSLALQIRLLYRYSFRSVPRGVVKNGLPPPSRGVFYFRLVTLISLLVSGLVFLVALIVGHVANDAVIKILYVERATSVLTGYSVLPSVMLLAAGFVAYAYYAIQRCYLGVRFHIHPPYPEPAAAVRNVRDPIVAQRCREICELAKSVHEELTSTSAFGRKRGVALGITLVAYVLCAIAILSRAQRTWEGFWWDEPFAAGFFLLAGLVLLTMWRFVDCWNGVKDILKKMALIPMVRAFDRLPRKTASLFGGYFFTRKPRATHLAIPLHILNELHAALRTSGSDVLAKTIAREVTACNADNSRQQRSQTPAREEYPGNEINRLSDLAGKVVDSLQWEWPLHSVANAFGEQPLDPAHRATSAGDSQAAANHAAPMLRWVEKAEDFVAIQAIIFLSQYFILLRTMVTSMVTGSVLLLLAATSYPFQPEKLILYLLLGLLTAVSGSILYVLVEINKDEVISRITQSTPNRFDLNWSFAFSILQYVGPIVLLLVGHFSGRLRSLIEPLYELLH